MNKFTKILETIIGISLTICLFLGGLGFIGFLVAFIIGGDNAIAICDFLKGHFYACLIKLSTITTILCFLLQYVNGNAKFKNPFKKKEETN